jgi:phage terminase large subunit-like protein
MTTLTKAKKLTATPISLQEAIVDRKLLRLELSAKQIELVDLIERHETTVAAAGRQSGKSLIGAALLVHNAVLRPDLDEIAGGGMRYCIAVANSQAQAGITLDYARVLVERSPLLRSRLISAQGDRLVFERATILTLPCQDRLMRGLTVSAAFLDEFGHFLSESDGPRVADRVYAAIRPSLVTYGAQSRLYIASTPFGDNLFSRLYSKARNGELPGAAAFTATTQEMNPKVSSEFLEQERQLLGEQDYRREFEAEFTAGAAGFFEEEAVRAVVGRHRELSADQGTHWVVGFDASFSIDPSAAAVVGRSSANREQLVVARVERWVPTRASKLRKVRQTLAGKQEVTDRVLDGVADLSRTYGDAPVVVDQHLPAVVVAGLKSRGVPKVLVRAWTPQSQTDAFRALRARVYGGRVTLPTDEQLLTELLRLRSRLRAGTSQVEIPRTGEGHCDLAVAVASAVLELDSRAIPTPLRVVSAVHLIGPSREQRENQLSRLSPAVDGRGLEAFR